MSVRIQALVDRLTRIADQDTRIVVSMNAAIRRMAELGVTSEQVRVWLAEPSEGEVVMGDKSFHGFESRQQAGYAALGGLAKKEWPAALQAVHERVTALIRNQEPERAGSDEGQIVMMPIVILEQPEPKRFRRMRSGKIKEIGARPEPDTIDVEAEDVSEKVMVTK